MEQQISAWLKCVRSLSSFLRVVLVTLESMAHFLFCVSLCLTRDRCPRQFIHAGSWGQVVPGPILFHMTRERVWRNSRIDR